MRNSKIKSSLKIRNEDIMIDRSLNYGRHLIEKYFRDIHNYKNVLDLGAGYGCYLMTSKIVNPNATLYALESNPIYLEELKRRGVIAFQINLEKEIYPY
jgi:16S rRNA A1518/A1519 N6-dimethyltransferase RsmA/KsgA/DIM1 with predicted DNA glycosylase/AP lyase activity